MSAPTLQFLVNGVDLTKRVLQDTWNVQMDFKNGTSTASIEFKDVFTARAGLHFTIQPLQTVAINDTGTGAHIFNGLITNPVFTGLKVTSAEWRCDAKDNTIWTDKAVVKGDYINSSGDYIIKQLAGQMPGTPLDTSGVSVMPQLARVVINYITMTEAIRKIIKLCSHSTYYGWRIDENRKLWVYDQTQVTLYGNYFTDKDTDSSANAYRYDPETIKYTWDGNDVRNRITVRGGHSTLSNRITDTWQATAAAQGSFVLTRPLHDQNANLVLTVGGVSKTIAINQGGAATTQWVATKTIPGMSPIRGLWFLNTGTDSAPTTGTVSLTYNYLIPVVTQVDGPSQATYSSLPNQGIFWSAINDPALVDIMTAKARAQRDLKVFQSYQERVTFDTIPPVFTGHVKAGDLINFRSISIPDSANSWTTGPLNANYFVTKVTIAGQQWNLRKYTIEAIRV